MAKPLNVWMPDNVDVGDGYTIRVTALDPSTGNTTANVNVGITVIEATAITTDTGSLAVGKWFLVPGPQA